MQTFYCKHLLMWGFVLRKCGAGGASDPLRLLFMFPFTFRCLAMLFADVTMDIDARKMPRRARLKKKQSVKEVMRYFFSRRVINRWNSLDHETVDVGSINSSKGRLDKIRKTRMGFLWILHGPLSPGPHGDGTP